MKFVLIATFLITGSAFAYNTSTVGNHPPKEEAIAAEKREPASVETKEMKPADKVKQAKVAPEK
jgi:hypothetical protein